MISMLTMSYMMSMLTVFETQVLQVPITAGRLEECEGSFFAQGHTTTEVVSHSPIIQLG